MSQQTINMIGTAIILIAYGLMLSVVIRAINNPRHWSHHTQESNPFHSSFWLFGKYATLVFMFTFVGLLLLTDKFIEGKLEIILLSLIGLTLVVLTPIFIIQLIKKKGIFRKLPKRS